MPPLAAVQRYRWFSNEAIKDLNLQITLFAGGFRVLLDQFGLCLMSLIRTLRGRVVDAPEGADEGGGSDGEQFVPIFNWSSL